DVGARPQARDAVFVFGKFLRPRVREIVATDSRMRFQVEKRLLLALKTKHQACEQSMFEHVGEVAGVKQVTIGEHGAKLTAPQARLLPGRPLRSIRDSGE